MASSQDLMDEDSDAEAAEEEEDSSMGSAADAPVEVDLLVDLASDGSSIVEPSTPIEAEATESVYGTILTREAQQAAMLADANKRHQEAVASEEAFWAHQRSRAAMATHTPVTNTNQFTTNQTHELFKAGQSIPGRAVGGGKYKNPF